MNCAAMKNGGLFTVNEKPGKDGKAGRAEDRGERDIAGEDQDDGEEADGGQSRERGSDQEDAEAGGDAFSAAEMEPDGEHVAEDSGEGCDGLGVAERHGRKQMRSQERTQPHGGGTFEHVEQKCGCAEAFSAGAKHVGGADVAAANRANVLMAKQLTSRYPVGMEPSR